MSIPFGPIGALCINRILQRGKWAGLASGFGLALGDSFFAALAVLGIAQITETLLRYQGQLELVAGALILMAGLRGYYGKAQNVDCDNKSMSAVKDAASMFLITIANPQTIIGFSAALTGMVGFYRIDTHMDALLLIGGIFTGSVIWWVALVVVFELLRGRLSADFTMRLSQASAVLVILLGVLLMGHALLPVAKSFL